MAQISDAHTVSVTVPRQPGDVYSYVTDPRNLPTWAAGLAKSVEQRDGQWIVDSGTGEWSVASGPTSSRRSATTCRPSEGCW